MNFKELKNLLPDHAKDIKLNLSRVLVEEGDGIKQNQIYAIALACAHATKNTLLIDTFNTEALHFLTEEEISAAKAAAVIMAMNNVYYRFVHLVSDKSYQQLPAQLRMNIMANPGTDKITFELMSLAVSAINGCGLCMDSHSQVLIKADLSKTAIQKVIRIAAVINAVAQALS